MEQTPPMVEQNNVASTPQTPIASKPNYWMYLSLFLIAGILVALIVWFVRLPKGTQEQEAEVVTTLPMEVDAGTLLDSKEKLLAYLNAHMQTGTIVRIPDTDLSVTVPSTYEPMEIAGESQYKETEMVLNYRKLTPDFVEDVVYCSERDTNKDVPLEIYTEEYCAPILVSSSSLYTSYVGYSMKGVNTFSVDRIKTVLTPREWVSQNVTYEGEKWDEARGTGKEIVVNGQTFFSVNTACCAGYTQMYLYPYETVNKEKILLAFVTNNAFGAGETQEEQQSDRNVILDTILATLTKVE